MIAKQSILPLPSAPAIMAIRADSQLEKKHGGRKITYHSFILPRHGGDIHVAETSKVYSYGLEDKHLPRNMFIQGNTYSQNTLTGQYSIAMERFRVKGTDADAINIDLFLGNYDYPSEILGLFAHKTAENLLLQSVNKVGGFALLKNMMMQNYGIKENEIDRNPYMQFINILEEKLREFAGMSVVQENLFWSEHA